MLNSCKLLLTPVKHPHPADLNIWRACFNAWHEVWSSTFGDLQMGGPLYSDGFINQDFVAIILSGEKIAGFCLFKQISLQNPAHLLDSWFAPWPRSLLDQLSSNYSAGIVPSYLTVLPEFRRTQDEKGARITDLLAEVMHLVTLDLRAEVCFGTPRRDRSVHKAMLKAGAICLQSEVPHFGVPVDLVSFLPAEVRDHNFSEQVLQLWAAKTDHRTATRTELGTYSEEKSHESDL